MTKIAAMPIYGQNIKKNLLQNLKSYDLETWHTALETIKAQQILYKWWSWIDLDLFDRSKLVAYVVECRKLLEIHLIGKPCSKWPHWQNI